MGDIRPGPGGRNPVEFTARGRRVIFHADDGTNGREPWISNGTTDGTKLVRDFAGLPSIPRNLTAFGGRLFFATGETAAPALRATDTTAEGTFRTALTITGGQVASALLRARNAAGGEPVAVDPTFEDVSGTHAGAIGALAAARVLAGFEDGSFRPNGPVTRGQTATMILNGLLTIDV